MAQRQYSLNAQRASTRTQHGLRADSAFPDLESELRSSSRNSNIKTRNLPRQHVTEHQMSSAGCSGQTSVEWCGQERRHGGCEKALKRLTGEPRAFQEGIPSAEVWDKVGKMLDASLMSWPLFSSPSCLSLGSFKDTD